MRFYKFKRCVYCAKYSIGRCQICFHHICEDHLILGYMSRYPSFIFFCSSVPTPGAKASTSPTDLLDLSPPPL